MLVNKSSTRLPDVNHDATANAALDDVAGRLDHLATPPSLPLARSLPPAAPPAHPRPPPARAANGPPGGCGAEKQPTRKKNRRAGGPKPPPPPQPTVPPYRVIESTLASVVELAA